MTLRTDIAAIKADETKTEEQKRADLYALKVSALVTLLTGMLNTNWIVNSVTYRMLSISQSTENGAPVLTIQLRRTGANFNVVDDVVFVNPPISDGTRDIDAMSNAQLATFGRVMIGTLPPPAGA